MEVVRFINSVFTSNTYLLYKNNSEEVWVIDPGSSIKQLIEWIESNGKILKGILLTHTHFDHINGLNDLQIKFPEAIVFASFYAKEGMLSEKLNGSYYQEIPFTIISPEMTIVKENDKILLWNDITLKVLETPGHDRDCLSFQVEKNLFTGDALIPGIKVHTKLKYSNKILAEESIKRIIDQFDNDTIIWPGHGENCFLETLK